MSRVRAIELSNQVFQITCERMFGSGEHFEFHYRVTTIPCNYLMFANVVEKLRVIACGESTARMGCVKVTHVRYQGSCSPSFNYKPQACVTRTCVPSVLAPGLLTRYTHVRVRCPRETRPRDGNSEIVLAPRGYASLS
jgi:hypothetical protein